MKIKYHDGTEEVKEKVVKELTHYYVTESGAQVPKASVISFDRRGGSKPGAGRKEADEKRVQTPIYLKRKHLESLTAEAEKAGVSLSSLINQKLGLD